MRLNKTFRLKDVLGLVHESLSHVTAEDWRKAVDHVEKVEQSYWTADALQEDTAEQLIIRLNSEESSTGESSSDSGGDSSATTSESSSGTK